ncbi:hypothetical protein GGD82_002436 [Roseospira marina]|nr:hypothetical protein [Roseospira marina]MBB4314541.1 hypothetical protein [Roseospira marina]
MYGNDAPTLPLIPWSEINPSALEINAVPRQAKDSLAAMPGHGGDNDKQPDVRRNGAINEAPNLVLGEPPLARRGSPNRHFKREFGGRGHHLLLDGPVHGRPQEQHIVVGGAMALPSGQPLFCEARDSLLRDVFRLQVPELTRQHTACRLD